MHSEKQVKPQNETTTTTCSNKDTETYNSLLATLDEAFNNGTKIKTGFEDEEIPSHSEVGCDLCLNGYIYNQEGKLEYCSCYHKHNFLVKLKKSRIPKEYHNHRNINIPQLRAGKKPYSDTENKPIEINPNDELIKIKNNFIPLMEQGWNFTIEGPTGTGKTTMATLIGKIALKNNKKVLFLELEELRRMWTGEELTVELQEAKKIIYSVDVLILDDLGKEFASEKSDYFIRNLDGLIRQRGSEKKMIIFTTNVNQANMKARYDDRIFSLMNKQNIHYVLHRHVDLRTETGLPDFLA